MLPQTVQMVQMSPHSPGPEAIIAAVLTFSLSLKLHFHLVTKTYWMYFLRNFQIFPISLLITTSIILSFLQFIMNTPQA